MHTGMKVRGGILKKMSCNISFLNEETFYGESRVLGKLCFATP